MRGNTFNRSRIIRVLLSSMLFLVLWNRLTAGSQTSEYLLKAVFLEKFTRFIDWPEYTGVGNPDQTFVIGILGENPFNIDLESLFRKQPIKNQRVEIRYLKEPENLDQCHMLFICRSESERLDSILQVIAEKPVLTVGDSRLFSGRGVLINFYVDQNKIRFEIDEKAIHRTELRISYLLMKEARIIHPDRAPE